MNSKSPLVLTDKGMEFGKKIADKIDGVWEKSVSDLQKNAWISIEVFLLSAIVLTSLLINKALLSFV